MLSSVWSRIWGWGRTKQEQRTYLRHHLNLALILAVPRPIHLPISRNPAGIRILVLFDDKFAGGALPGFRPAKLLEVGELVARVKD